MLWVLIKIASLRQLSSCISDMLDSKDTIFILSIGKDKPAQSRPRSDIAEHCVWSGLTLFATHPAILDTLTDSRMNLLKS